MREALNNQFFMKSILSIFLLVSVSLFTPVFSQGAEEKYEPALEVTDRIKESLNCEYSIKQMLDLEDGLVVMELVFSGNHEMREVITNTILELSKVKHTLYADWEVSSDATQLSHRYVIGDTLTLLTYYVEKKTLSAFIHVM